MCKCNTIRKMNISFNLEGRKAILRKMPGRSHEKILINLIT